VGWAVWHLLRLTAWAPAHSTGLGLAWPGWSSASGWSTTAPSAVAFTLVPERLGHYFGQQLRWMRGTTVRHLWWLRHMRLRSAAFWMPVVEYAHLLLALCIPAAVLADPGLRAHWPTLLLHTVLLGCAMATCRRIGSWGTRDEVEVRAGGREAVRECSPAALPAMRRSPRAGRTTRSR
jgi:hypothetical protein